MDSLKIHSHLNLEREKRGAFSSMSDSESFPSELESSDEEEEVTPLTEQEQERRYTLALEIGQQLLDTIPVEPEAPVERMLYLFFYATQYVVMFTKFDGNMPGVEYMHDKPEVIREKSYYLHLKYMYLRFNETVKKCAQHMYDTVLSNLIARFKTDDHPLIYFVRQLHFFKELHSRRIKADPAASRTKTDVIRKTFNVITNEEYDPLNPNHKWHMLILNPLPSDYNPNLKDPKEGGVAHSLSIEVDKLKNQHFVPEPFFVAVTPNWDTTLRMMHTLLHFNDYMQMYLMGTVSLDTLKRTEHMTWRETWSFLFKEFADVPIEKFSREKKKTPLIVSRTAELRDFLKEAVLLTETQK
jgi:hypothetical protein